MTFWQKWDRAPWYIKSIQFWVTGIAATYLFVITGFDYRIAGLAGLIGTNIAIFFTISYLAYQDEQKNDQQESE